MILPHVAALGQKRIVLASGSPRRKELLSNLGLKFEVLVSSFDETLPKERFPRAADYAVETAKHKALDVAALCAAQQQQQGVDLIISADTVVEHQGRILEKPDDEQHAFDMLTSLSGSEHHVHTGVVLLVPNPLQAAAAAAPSSTLGRAGAAAASTSCSGRTEAAGRYQLRCFSCTTAVHFAELPPELIWAYIKSGEPFGKAGSYGIQGIAGSFVRQISGCFYNVVGFPVHAFSQELLSLVQDGYLPLEGSPLAPAPGAAAASVTAGATTDRNWASS